jgi:fatty acid desaturase
MPSSHLQTSVEKDQLLKSILTQLLLKDQRDWPFVKQILLTILVLFPLSVSFYFFSAELKYLVPLYWALVIFFLGPHLLMLHNICHRSPWKKSYKRPLDILVSVMGLLFGLPPMIYYHHHIKMHHKEGNGKDDLSTTETFKRDSFLGWLKYFGAFIFTLPFELPAYFIKRGRKDYALNVILGYILFYSVLITAIAFNELGAIFVFIVPTLICWFGLMGGNWAQHAFVDQEDPECPYKNSITVVDSLYNKRCFNDGYHIGHHLFPGMHWTEMPAEFEKNRDKYYDKGAMVFRKLDYQMIWLLLMLKQYRKLAEYYVPREGEKVDTNTIVEIIKKRLVLLN